MKNIEMLNHEGLNIENLSCGGDTEYSEASAQTMAQKCAKMHSEGLYGPPCDTIAKGNPHHGAAKRRGADGEEWSEASAQTMADKCAAMHAKGMYGAPCDKYGHIPLSVLWGNK